MINMFFITVLILKPQKYFIGRTFQSGKQMIFSKIILHAYKICIFLQSQFCVGAIVPLHNGSAPDFGSGCGGSIPPGTTMEKCKYLILKCLHFCFVAIAPKLHHGFILFLSRYLLGNPFGLLYDCFGCKQPHVGRITVFAQQSPNRNFHL